MKCVSCGDDGAIFQQLCPGCWNRGPERSSYPELRRPDHRQNGKPRTKKSVSYEDRESDPTPARVEPDTYKPESLDKLLWWAHLQPKEPIGRFSNWQEED